MTPEQKQQAAETWQAYNAMETTKQRHFDFLSELERRHKQLMLPANEKEEKLLAQLLTDHDEQVKRFQVASNALRENHPQAHDALFAYIGEINKALQPYRNSN